MKFVLGTTKYVVRLRTLLEVVYGNNVRCVHINSQIFSTSMGYFIMSVIEVLPQQHWGTLVL